MRVKHKFNQFLSCILGFFFFSYECGKLYANHYNNFIHCHCPYGMAKMSMIERDNERTVVRSKHSCACSPLRARSLSVATGPDPFNQGRSLRSNI